MPGLSSPSHTVSPPHSRPSFCLFLTFPHPRPRSISPPLLSCLLFSFFYLPLRPSSFKVSTFAIFLSSRVVFSLLCDEISGPATTTEAFLSPTIYPKTYNTRRRTKNTTSGQNRTIRALKIKPDDDETDKRELIRSPEIHPFTAFE